MVRSLLLTALLLPPVQAQSVPEAVNPEGVALVIDGVEIPMARFAPWLLAFRGETKAVEFAELWLLEREAQRLGQTVPSEVVRAETEARLGLRIDQVFGGSRRRWLDEIEKEHRTEEGLELELDIQVRGELTAAAILAVERQITDEMLRRAFEYRYGRGGHSIDARVIELELVIPPAPPGATQPVLARQREEATESGRQTALSVRSRIAAGESFEALARRYSAHDSAASGGSIEGGFRPGEFSPQVLDELEKVPAGVLSEPIFGMGSWWLFDVRDVRQVPFESVREDLRREMMARPPTPEEYANLRARLLADAEWTVLPAMWAGPGPEGESRPAGEAVMEIDGVPIRRAEFTRWLLHFHGEVIAPRFVEGFVLEREAERRGVTISADEIDRRIAADIETMFRESGYRTEDEWRESLAKVYRSPESIRRELLVANPPVYLAADMLVAEREITDAMVERRWQEKYGAGGQTVEARMIRMQIAPARPPRSDRGAMERAREIYLEKKAVMDELVERLANGEDFGALARRYSDDPDTRLHGGEFPEGFVLSDWPSDVAEALMPLEPGQVSEILEVEGNTAIAVFQVLERREVPLESVKAEIRRELASEPPSKPDLAAFRNVLVRDVPYRIGPAMSAS